jgi:hypothetical protein
MARIGIVAALSFGVLTACAGSDRGGGAASQDPAWSPPEAFAAIQRQCDAPYLAAGISSKPDAEQLVAVQGSLTCQRQAVLADAAFRRYPDRDLLLQRIDDRMAIAQREAWHDITDTQANAELQALDARFQGAIRAREEARAAMVAPASTEVILDTPAPTYVPPAYDPRYPLPAPAPSYIPRPTSPTVVQPFGNGYIVDTRGRPPTTVQPFGNGYVANTMGQPPATMQPFGNGYIVNQPGTPPTTINRFGNGYVVNTPGQAPTTVRPFGNGYIINTPGRAPTTVRPFGNGWIENTPGQMPTTIQEW